MSYINFRKVANSVAAGLLPDLVAWWDFEEDDATTLWLDSHSTHDLTLLNSRTTSQDKNNVGRVNHGVLIDTTNNTGGRVPRADTAFDKADASFSFGFWWNSVSIANDDLTRFLAGRYGGTTTTDQSYYVVLRTLAGSQGFTFGFRNGADTAYANFNHTGGVPVAVDTWYFVVWAYDAANDVLYGYVNGTKQSTSTNTAGGVYASTTANFSFGNGYRSDTTYYDTARDHVGTFDSMFFMNRLITDAEEAYLRNSGAGKNYAALLVDAS